MICPYCSFDAAHGLTCPLAAFDRQMREVLAHLSDLVVEVHDLWKLVETLKALPQANGDPVPKP